MNIPKETLIALRNELPEGAQTLIAEKLSFSIQYVNNILSGRHTLTAHNMPIIKEAQRLIRKDREDSEKLLKDLNKTISE